MHAVGGSGPREEDGQEKEVEPRLIFDFTFLVWGPMGYGKLSVLDVKHEGGGKRFRKHAGGAAPLGAFGRGNFAGSVGALPGKGTGIDYRETSPGVCRIIVFEAGNPAELEAGLRWEGCQKRA